MPEEKKAALQRRPQSQKREIQNERKRVANKAVNSSIKTAIRAYHEAQPAERSGMLPRIYSLIDKAAKRNIFSPNKASRTKSRLASA